MFDEVGMVTHAVSFRHTFDETSQEFHGTSTEESSKGEKTFSEACTHTKNGIMECIETLQDKNRLNVSTPKFTKKWYSENYSLENGKKSFKINQTVVSAESSKRLATPVPENPGEVKTQTVYKYTLDKNFLSTENTETEIRQNTSTNASRKVPIKKSAWARKEDGRPVSFHEYSGENATLVNETTYTYVD